MYRNIKTAVAGTGFIGPVHVEALRRLGISVKGILGSSTEKSAQAARELSLETAYATFDEILEDDDINVVHIATPNHLHYEFARRALLAGKHVMCEKPLAMSADESQDLVKLAESTGLHAGVTYNVRFYPMNIEAHRLLAERMIGRVFTIAGSYVQDWLLFDSDFNWRVQSQSGGALRAVADIGTHWMDLIQFVTNDKIVKVFADLMVAHPVRKKAIGDHQTFSSKGSENYEEINVDTEDFGSIIFHTKNGSQGVFYVSQITAGYKNRIRYEISGSESSVSWDSDHANDLLVGHRNVSNQQLTKDPSLTLEATRAFISYPGGHAEGFPDTFKQCFKAFYGKIVGEWKEDVDYPTFAQGHQEVKLCEAILKSHRQGKWIEL